MGNWSYNINSLSPISYTSNSGQGSRGTTGTSGSDAENQFWQLYASDPEVRLAAQKRINGQSCGGQGTKGVAGYQANAVKYPQYAQYDRPIDHPESRTPERGNDIYFLA